MAAAVTVFCVPPYLWPCCTRPSLSAAAPGALVRVPAAPARPCEHPHRRELHQGLLCSLPSPGGGRVPGELG